MILLVRCPHCRGQMKYQPQKKVIGNSKKCVYCGKSFVVNRERILSHKP